MCDEGRFFLWTSSAGANCSGGQPGRVTLDQIKTGARQADWQVEAAAKVSVQASLRVRGAMVAVATERGRVVITARRLFTWAGLSIRIFTLHILIHHHPPTSSSNHPFQDT